MNSFPLYDSISGSLTEDFKYDPQEVCKLLKELDDQQQEYVAGFVHHHYLLQNSRGMKKNNIPYQGKSIADNKVGLIWCFENLPVDLQRIISKYVYYLGQK